MQLCISMLWIKRLSTLRMNDHIFFFFFFLHQNMHMLYLEHHPSYIKALEKFNRKVLEYYKLLFFKYYFLEFKFYLDFLYFILFYFTFK
jgi:hypothetical protein